MSFSPIRFKYLLVSRLQENKRKYTWFAGLLFLSYLLVFVVFFSTVNEFLQYTYQTKNSLPNEFQRHGDNEWNDFVPGLFWAGLFISSILFAAASYVNFSNPGEGILYLTRPASNLEKWLGEVLIHTLGFLLVYLACYSLFAGLGTWITDLVAETEFRALLDGKNFILRKYSQEVHLNPSRVESEFYLPFRKALVGSDYEVSFIEYWACTLFLFGVGFCQLGAVFFNRFSFFKTLFTAAVLGLAFGLLMLFTWKLLIPEDWWFGGTHVTNSDYNQTTRLSDSYLGLLYTLSPLVFVFWIYACGFLAVKEKRV